MTTTRQQAHSVGFDVRSFEKLDTAIDDGCSTTSESIEVLTTVPVLAERVITFAGAYATPATAASLRTIAGITVAAASSGVLVEVVSKGVYTSLNTWVAGPVYVTTSGVLTQTHSPAWAFVRIIGYQLSANKIVVDLQPIIQQV
mgnify:CR=1 FL=1